ncbi:MAG TPA: AfsR/SARP family transcriptional regulator [Gaiellaceae bacterium]|nr:AfsR/SARP family transcriptional regulator [Gaiellaceae bacterium]
MLEFRLLGPLEVLDGDRPVRLGGPKQRAALAILLLSANRVVSVEQLADDLYAGAPPVTAVTQVQRQVSELRKVLGAEAIETRSPGYVLHVEPGRLDLDRFERATHDAAQALETDDAQAAAALLDRALGLWRGAPLADLAYESFAQTAIGRLEELRLAALEQHVDAELRLGRHLAVLGELESLVWDHPLRERLRGQLMLALYRAGRQAEALDVYRRTRETLVGEFGIEPSPALHDLERRILTQDPALEPLRAAAGRYEPAERMLLVVPSSGGSLEPLLALAEPLAALPARTLLITRLLAEAGDVTAAAAELAARGAALDAPARTAAFTSLEPARDVIRLATNYDVELVLLDGLEDEVAGDLAAIVGRSPADVAILCGGRPARGSGEGVFVPFGGGDHDWAALELGAWLAGALAAPLRLVGTTADPRRGRRDASRLLADASLAAQRVVGVTAEPLLAEPTADGLLAAVEAATVVVAGLPSRWRVEGLGVRRVLVERAAAPVLLVHGGMRPGGLAPRESRTQFSWSLGSTA